MVDHNILVRKLGMYGFGHQACSWFKSYLSGRVQATKVNGQVSDERVMSCGVPQGSILGPLLFIIYINDLKCYLNECKVSLYADDTALFAALSSYIDLMLSLRIDMSVISEW